MEWAFTLPDRLKLTRGETKRVVRHATASYVPQLIRARTDKMGFTSPQEVWQRRLLEPWLRQGIERVQLGFIDRDRVRAEYDRYVAGARDDPLLLVPPGLLRLVAGARTRVSPPRRPLLVIAYKFPPYAGVGGFRWAKLSKYLARLGHEVHVVTVPWPEHGPNTLAADAAEPGVIVHPIRSGSPHRLRHMPLSGRWTIAARYFALRALDRVLFYDDEAQRWGRHLIGACERLIDEHDIGVVVATGHPFQANRWAAELKRRQPGLRLVQDFRDPWADNPFRTLSPRLAARVRAWQEDAVAAADAVVSVTPSLLDLYLRGATEPRGVVIPNGADPATVPDVHATATGTPDGSGSRTSATCPTAATGPCEPCSMPCGSSTAGPDDRGRAGGRHARCDRAREPRPRGARLAPGPSSAVPRPRRCARVAASDYALQLNAREFPYLVSTKIYEYALLRVPALSLNYGGEVDTLVRDHGFGHSVDLSRRPDLPELLRSLPERAAADRGGGLRVRCRAVHVPRAGARVLGPDREPMIARVVSALRRRAAELVVGRLVAPDSRRRNGTRVNERPDRVPVRIRRRDARGAHDRPGRRNGQDVAPAPAVDLRIRGDGDRQRQRLLG